MRFGGLMDLPHTTVEVEADVPSGRLGAAGGGSASRGGVRGSQAAYSTLAAAETAPGRGPITKGRLLLTAKST